jgi:hypothetical protein
MAEEGFPMRQSRTIISALLLVACFAARTDHAALAAPGDQLPEAIPWRQTSFVIPFKVPDASPGEAPVEIRLYVSKNLGRNWELAQSVSPKERNFMFRATGDGEYWFQIHTLDQQGRLIPEVGGPPGMRVIIDTQPPRFELSATRGEAGEIKANWQAVDPLLNADSLKIEYETTSGGWRAVALDRPPATPDRSTTAGTLTWFPNDAPPGNVIVRGEISDRAGNVAAAQTKTQTARTPNPPDIASPASDHTAQSRSAGPPPLSLTAAGPPPNTNNPNNQSNSSGAAWPADQSPTPWNSPSTRPNETTSPSTTPPLGRHPIPSNDNFTLPPDHASTGAPSSDRVAARPSSPPRSDNVAQRPAPRSTTDSSQAATSGPAIDAATTGSAASSYAQLPAGVRPLMVNSRSFDMDYEVDAVGPSGIAKVELWGTRDSGRTWTSYGIDPDNRSPIRATVEGEGLYGFRVVVQSGSGLGGLPPKSGDQPDIWVAVDLTKPLVRLTDVQFGEGPNAGELLIRWQASDSAFAVRPISLLFSEKPGGPWATIAAGLENSGQYTWRPDSRVPDRIYLRIEARDEAGNIGTFDLPQPVAIDRVRPGGRIRGIRPSTDSAATTQGPQDVASAPRVYEFR